MLLPQGALGQGDQKAESKREKVRVGDRRRRRVTELEAEGRKRLWSWPGANQSEGRAIGSRLGGHPLQGGGPHKRCYGLRVGGLGYLHSQCFDFLSAWVQRGENQE